MLAEVRKGSLFLSEIIINGGSMIWCLLLPVDEEGIPYYLIFLMFFSTIDSSPKFSVLMGILYFHAKFHRLLVCPLKCIWNFAVSFHLIGFCPHSDEQWVLEGQVSWITFWRSAVYSARNIKRKMYFFCGTRKILFWACPFCFCQGTAVKTLIQFSLQ